MKHSFAALFLVAVAFATMRGEETASGIGEPESDHGYWPKSSGIQSLGVSTYEHGDPTIYEQYLLEMINRARTNPGAEAQKYGINLNQGLDPGTISDTPKQPLAFHQSLIASSRAHSQWMLDTDTFSHTGTNGTNSTQRMTAAGYPFSGSWGSGENLAWYGSGTNVPVNFKTYTEELHKQLILSKEHRKNLMLEPFDQVGVGLIAGDFLNPEDSKIYKVLMGTENFAYSAGSPSPDGPFVLGVAYKDDNGNNFYDPGEGLGGVTVNLLPGDTTTTTSTSGGYAIPLGTTSGALVLTFSGGAVATSTQVTGLAFPGVNVKVDLILAATSTTTRVIALSGDLNFGPVSVGGSVSRTLTISNTGNSPLVVTGISHSDGVFTGNVAGTIGAGKSKPVTITFKPTTIQAYDGTLAVTSNATSGTSTQAESGTGVAAPVVSTPVITPDGGSFIDKIKVTITSATPKATIRVTQDGSEPTVFSRKCSGKLTIKTTGTLKARAFKTGYTESDTASATFTID